MENLTKVNPLIANFMVPETPKVFSEKEMTLIYDPKSQITFLMGGNSGPSRSYDGYKGSRWRDAGGSIHTGNDAERWTDD